MRRKRSKICSAQTHNNCAAGQDRRKATNKANTTLPVTGNSRLPVEPRSTGSLAVVLNLRKRKHGRPNVQSGQRDAASWRKPAVKALPHDKARKSPNRVGRQTSVFVVGKVFQLSLYASLSRENKGKERHTNKVAVGEPAAGSFFR